MKIKTPEKMFSFNKALVPLKIVIFTWEGASSVISPFLQVFMKQKGLTIAQISIIYAVSPVFQFFFPVLFGIIADKTGRQKIVLVASILLFIFITNCMLFIPSKSQTTCDRYSARLKCDSLEVLHQDFEKCDLLNQRFCKVNCSNSSTSGWSSKMNNSLSSEKLEDFHFKNFYQFVHNYTFNDEQKSCQINQPSNHLNGTCRNEEIQCSLTCCLTKLEIGEDYNDTVLIFGLTLAIVVIYYIFRANIHRALDYTSMTILTAHEGDFGIQKFWGVLGMCLFSVISGYVVDATSSEDGPKNYNVVLYLFDGMILFVVLAVLNLNVKLQPPGKKMLKKSLHLFKHLDLFLFFTSVLCLGTFQAFKKQFTSLYLDEIGAPSLLLGLRYTCINAFALPILTSSSFFIDKIGSTYVLVLGFLSYTVCFVGYSFLQDPWWCLPIELTSIFHGTFLWVAVVRHSHAIALEGLTATVISTAGGIHYALGKGTGSVLGGLIMNHFGGRIAYRTFAVMSFVVGLFYALYLYFQSNDHTQEEEKKEKIQKQGSIEKNGLPPVEIKIHNEN